MLIYYEDAAKKSSLVKDMASPTTWYN